MSLEAAKHVAVLIQQLDLQITRLRVGVDQQVRTSNRKALRLKHTLGGVA
jgi:hypothetical protein